MTHTFIARSRRTAAHALPSAALLLLATAALAGPPAPASVKPAALAPDSRELRVLLAPAQETTLSSQLSGRIQSMHVGLGQHFSKGQVLLRFDCDEQAARLRMSQSDQRAAQDHHEARLRLQGLQQAGELEVAVAASQAEKAAAQVGLHQAQLSQCTVAAPFSGRVVKLAAKAYQGAAVGQPLLEIVSDGPVKLRLNAPGAWVGWLRRGTRFEVQIDETGRRYRATVTSINARIDATSQTVEIEGTVDARSPELLPGMSGTARFARAKA